MPSPKPVRPPRLPALPPSLLPPIFALLLPTSLVFTAGCVNDLFVAPAAQIRCVSDADCPEDFRCVANACKSQRTNEPPRASIGSIDRSLDAVPIPLTLSDAEADAVDLQVELRASAAGSFVPLALSGTTGLAVGVEPSSFVLDWSTASDDLAAAGAPGFAGEVVLRVTPRDAYGPGIAVESAPFSHGNDAPELVDVVLDDTTVTGNSVVRFFVRDSASDAVALETFTVSEGGDFSDAIDLPLSEGSGGTFPGGSLVDLRSNPTGVWHNVTWDSRQGANYDAPSAAVRLRVRDSQGALSVLVTSAPFAANNAQSPPSLTVTPLVDLTQTINSDVQLSIFIDDADGDSCTLFAYYSLDNVTWERASTADNIVGLAPGVPHPFTWDISQLPPLLHDEVWLRFEVRDSQVGEIETLPPFEVDATVASAVDSSPPNYISPTTGTVLTDGNVLLQWTSRLGATSYTVQVSTEPDFDPPTVVTTYAPDPPDATELSLSLADDLTYYWRVRANVTAPANAYSSLGGDPAEFHLFLGTMYVYCDADPCTDEDAIGNRGRPYRRLGPAVARAASLGISTVKVASRPGDAPYDGILVVQNGVSVLGGYAPANGAPADNFDELDRDPLGNPTVVSGGISLPYGAVAAVAENIVQPTTLSGLDLRGPAASTHAYGLRVLGSSSALVIAQTSISSGAATTNSIALELTSSAPDLDEVTVVAGASRYSTGLKAYAGSGITIRDSQVSGGAATSLSIGIDGIDSPIDLDDVDVSAGPGTTTGAASEDVSVGLMKTGTNPLSVAGGSIRGSAATGTAARSLGLLVNGGTVNLDQTLIEGGDSPNADSTVGAAFGGDVSGTVTDTTIRSSPAGSAAPNEVGLVLSGLTAAPLTVERCTVSAEGRQSSLGLETNNANLVLIDSNISATLTPHGSNSLAKAMWLRGTEPVTVTTSTISGGDAPLSFGLDSAVTDLQVTGARISSGSASQSVAVQITGGTSILAASLVRAGPGTTFSRGVSTTLQISEITLSVENVIATSGAGGIQPSASIYVDESGPQIVTTTISETILVPGAAADDNCIFQQDYAETQALDDIIMVECDNTYHVLGGMNSHFYLDLCSGDLLDRVACPACVCSPGPPPPTILCDPGDCSSSTRPALFADFDPTDFASWTLLGGWTAGDPGTDATLTGAP